jgi:hypothetical protein
MRISTYRTKALAFKGKRLVRLKIIVNYRNIEKLLYFNYLGFNVNSDEQIDINVKKTKISTSMW